jgi:thioesterase domain-containing protein
VTFEIAQQLLREGERVSFLGLIDTGLLNPPDARQSLRSRVDHHLFAFFENLRSIREAIGKRWYILKLYLRQPIPYEHRTAWYDWLGRRASRNYVPTPYAGHITMFSSAGNFKRQQAHWGPLAGGGLTILEVPASHDDMVLPPHSKRLAEHFDACLDASARGESARAI